MTDFLDEKRKEIADRLRELRPLVEEYQRLEAAQAALEGVASGPGRAHARATSRRSPARTRRGSGGRRRGGGTRAAQALELVKAQPGIAIPELAERMGIKQNYLYRVLPGLEQEGQVRKEGRGWYPAA
jgi:sugar-specific transcriptional regulator TrmB